MSTSIIQQVAEWNKQDENTLTGLPKDSCAQGWHDGCIVGRNEVTLLIKGVVARIKNTIAEHEAVGLDAELEAANAELVKVLAQLGTEA